MSNKGIMSLKDYVQEKSGQDILACYHCRKCSVGCPVTPFMDVQPNAIHRMIQYDQKKEILRSSTIWLCAGCETCGTRCPNEIDIAKVMDALKQMAIAEGVRSAEKKVMVFHQVFLSGISKRGRMHELSLIRDMRLRSGGYFKDMGLGIKMFRMGKLSIFPDKVKSMKEVKKLFKKSKRIQ
jgi:heterodisulfide reductase subunit C